VVRGWQDGLTQCVAFTVLAPSHPHSDSCLQRAPVHRPAHYAPGPASRSIRPIKAHASPDWPAQIVMVFFTLVQQKCHTRAWLVEEWPDTSLCQLGEIWFQESQSFISVIWLGSRQVWGVIHFPPSICQIGIWIWIILEKANLHPHTAYVLPNGRRQTSFFKLYVCNWCCKSVSQISIGRPYRKDYVT
jgi:hypothetical protein